MDIIPHDKLAKRKNTREYLFLYIHRFLLHLNPPPHLIFSGYGMGNFNTYFIT